ncbi:MAG: TonB-dependent receptor [Desulfobacteraceae bacterium]|nr:TonB-dependent receptor [Desulfobacteraceae bacterium]
MMLSKKRVHGGPELLKAVPGPHLPVTGREKGIRYLLSARSGVILVTIHLAMMLLLAPSASAQAETTQQETGQEREICEDHKIESIIVTAQKREENVQKVPISITVFSDTQIEDAGIEDTMDLTQFTPNVYLKNAVPENTIIIRGVTSFHSAVYSPGGFYVDDVNFPLQYMHNTELFDIERIEVLKGPQGTLYGRNTESGVINIVTKQPDNEFLGRISASYGNYDTWRLGAKISGPIIKDELYLGLAGQLNRSDGFVTNEYNDDDEATKLDHRNIRGTLRWTPTDRWDISFIADALDADDNHAVYRFYSGPDKTDRHKSRNDYPGTHNDQQGNGQTLRLKHDGDSFDFLSISSMRYYNRDLVGDRDMTARPESFSQFAWKDRQLSQEIRLSSAEDNGLFEWLVGLYGFREKLDTRTHINFIGKGPYWDHLGDMDVNGYAAFGQATYTLFGKLHLTAGLRFDHHDLEGQLKGKPSMASPAGQHLEKDLDYNEVLPKVAVACDFTENIMGSVSVSKGYLIGGYNYTSAFSEEALTYDPEYTWNYEMGLKTTWLNDKLLANAAVFYIDIDDKQVREADPTRPAPGAQHVKNAAKAHSQGIELELQAKPMPNLDLFAGFGYTEAKIDSWVSTDPGGNTFDYEDKYLIFAPKCKYNLSAQYRHGTGFFGRIDLLTVGDYYCDSKNTLEHDAYQTVNLRLGYESEHFDVILWGKNIFDEESFNYMVNFGPNVLVADGDPMTAGVTVTYRF